MINALVLLLLLGELLNDLQKFHFIVQKAQNIKYKCMNTKASAKSVPTLEIGRHEEAVKVLLQSLPPTFLKRYSNTDCGKAIRYNIRETIREEYSPYPSGLHTTIPPLSRPYLRCTPPTVASPSIIKS